MRKAKAKTKARKKKSSPKTRRKLEIDSTLKARLEAEFARAVRSAKAYADDPLRLRGLFQDAAETATSLRYRTATSGALCVWGAQAASLQLPAACRRPFRVANFWIKKASASCRDEQAGSLCSPDGEFTPTARPGFPISGGVLSDTPR